MAHLQKLLTGEQKLAILGMGYVGYSNMLRYIRRGINCVISDFDEERLDDFARGEYPPKNRFLFWKGVEENEYLMGRKSYEICRPDEALRDDVSVYLICVPYDYRGGEGSRGLLKALDIFKHLKEHDGQKPILIVESLLKPYTIDREVIPHLRELGLEPGQDISLAYAPRLDWDLAEFEADVKPRFVACTGEDCGQVVKDILGLVSNDIRAVDDFLSVEVAECYTKAASYVLGALSAQLMFAYPNVDVRKCLDLVDRLPRFPNEYMNMGFELPLSSESLIERAPNPAYLTIINEALSAHFSSQQMVVEMIKRAGVSKVGVLGLLPHENRAEYDSSPTLLLPRLLDREGLSVSVHDPFMNKEKIEHLTGCRALSFPDDLCDLDCVVVHTPHSGYLMLGQDKLFSYLSNCKLVVDTTGHLEQFDFSRLTSVDYVSLGRGVPEIDT